MLSKKPVSASLEAVGFVKECEAVKSFYSHLSLVPLEIASNSYVYGKNVADSENT